MPTLSLPGAKVTTPIFKDYLKSFKEMIDAKTFQCDDLTYDTQDTSIADDMIPGEKSSFGEHHVGEISGKLYKKIQAGVLASITFNKTDDFVDMVAHNYQMFNSGFKIRSICDYGRTYTETLTSPLLGPFADDQYANHTIKIVSGWFASGQAIQSNDIFSKGKLNSDIWSDELGIHSIKSSIGGWIAKSNGIYVPIKNFEADDPTGQGDKNISGVSPRAGFKIDGYSRSHPESFGCQVRDYVAWQTSGQYRFARHNGYKKDWTEATPVPMSVPPLSATSQVCGYNEVITLRPKQTSGTETINNDSSDFRPGDAFCGALPDGSVLMRDAWGGFVKLGGGKVEIGGVKDVEITSGRNTVILSGGDTVVRAQGAAEIYCTDESVRIRGGKNVLVDSKNGAIQLTAEYSPLVDLNAKGGEYAPSGIILKTAAEVLLHGQNVGIVSDGIVSVLGKSDTTAPFVILKSSTQLNWAEKGHYLYTGDGTGTLTDDMVIISNGDVFAGGDGHFGSTVYCQGDVWSEGNMFALANIGCNGYIASNSNGPQVLEFKDPILKPQYESQFETDFANASAAVVKQEWIDDARLPLDKNSYDKIQYKYRTTDEYGTTGWKWFENFWQRQYLSELAEWTHLHNDVDADNEMPYPGKDHLSGGTSLVTYTEKNVNPDGTPKKASEQFMIGGTWSDVPLSSMKFHPVTNPPTTTQQTTKTTNLQHNKEKGTPEGLTKEQQEILNSLKKMEG